MCSTADCIAAVGTKGVNGTKKNRQTSSAIYSSEVNKFVSGHCVQSCTTYSFGNRLIDKLAYGEGLGL